ncbi:MAG: hypothetical protein ACREBR_00065 [bacterium]
MSPADRPDIICRIFRHQIEEMKGMLFNGDVPDWETAKALMFVAEFQKGVCLMYIICLPSIGSELLPMMKLIITAWLKFRIMLI